MLDPTLLESLEPEVQEILLDCQVEARDNGHRVVHTVHVLAVVLERGGKLAEVFTDNGITTEDVRVVYRLIPSSEGMFSSDHRPPFSMQVLRAIMFVSNNSDVEDDADLQVRALLQTMMVGKKDEWSPVICHALKRHGADIRTLTNALEAQPV